ncbi:putative membrane-associated kinase regulator 6 [Forsythia ovata]|uniref:Membrane-associated kinase regulator 6 n=1 Tax=Forsythia ovata TaxID=205694 RepID=A0ABD1Q2J1_9LAMI
MENSNPLATESFSYSWLIHKNPSSDYLIKFPEICTKEDNFKFDFPVSASPFSLVHADEIFSDGHIMPTYVERSKTESFSTSTSPISSYSLRSRSELFPEGSLEKKLPGQPRSTRYFILGKWRKSSKRVLQKCFGFVRPFCKTLGYSRKNIRVDDLDRKVWEVQSWSNSLQASPRPSTAYSEVDYELKKIGSRESPRITASYSCNACADIESSINEAILYCKRSIACILHKHGIFRKWATMRLD